MTHALESLPGSPFGQIPQALRELKHLAQIQEIALVRYSTSMGLCELNHSKDSGLLQSQVKTAFDLLHTDLLKIIPRTQKALSLVEDDLLSFEEKAAFSLYLNEEVSQLILKNLQYILDSVYRATERLEGFRTYTQCGVNIKEIGMSTEADTLLEAIDDALALSNRHWFCYKDLEQILQNALS